MILLPSFLVCVETLLCYTAVYNLNKEVFELANHYFLARVGWLSMIVTKINKHICQGYSVPLLLLVYTRSLSAEFM